MELIYIQKSFGSSNVWDYRAFPFPSELTLGPNTLTWSRPFLPQPFLFSFIRLESTRYSYRNII
jgi:hypothetical protein